VNNPEENKKKNSASFTIFHVRIVVYNEQIKENDIKGGPYACFVVDI